MLLQANQPLEFDPGERYQYSLGLDVVGGLVELVSGKRFRDYMRENIFEPLGMKRTYFHHNEQTLAAIASQYEYDSVNKCAIEIPADEVPYRFGSEYDSGSAGLISCVDDYILLADALTHYGVGKTGERILSKQGVNLMRTNALDENAIKYFTEPHMAGYGYGYGVRVNMTPAKYGNLSPIGEFGWDSAKNSYISCDPDNKISVFHAEHMGGVHRIVQPRLRNLIYSCLGDL